MSILPKGWTTVALGDVSTINPKSADKPNADDPVSFVPMAELHADSARTSHGTTRPFHEVSKGYRLFQQNDLLVAKITPCFQNNKIGQARISHNRGVGSTEFHVVHPLRGSVDDRYLLHFLRQDWIRVEGERKMTGSGGQRRIPQKFLERLSLPLPPLNEQRRIAAILDHAIRVENLRHSQLSSLKSLSMAAYHEIFDLGSLTPEPLGHHIAEHQLGLDRRAAEQGPQRAHSYLKMDSITSSGGLDLNKATRVDATEGELAKFNVGDGDMLLNTRNTRELVGKTAIYRGSPRLYNNNLMRIRFNETLRPDYVHHFLWTTQGRRQLEFRKSGTTSVFAVYAKDLVTLRLPIPPMRDQIEFENFVNKCNEKHSSLSLNGQDHDRLKYSLRTRAFRGEL